MRLSKATLHGFTLIELSIVLVIIGLIVGGILTGQSLISAAAARAQIAQIEKYNTAANTFRGKYGYLPGDIPDPDASKFGFASRGWEPGTGDGNGIIQGYYAFPLWSASGEEGMFWVDLSAAHLIDGGFNTATPTAGAPVTTGASIALYFPPAKIGLGNYIYIWNGGPSGTDAYNYFGLSAVTDISSCFANNPDSNADIPVSMAYSIDNKIDDSLPQAGRVTATYVSCATFAGAGWAGNSSFQNYDGASSFTSATPASSTSCFDNGNSNGKTQSYSIEKNGGSGTNCALSFRMQAGIDAAQPRRLHPHRTIHRAGDHRPDCRGYTDWAEPY